MRNIAIVGGNTGIGLKLVRELSGIGTFLYLYSRNSNNIIHLENTQYRFFDASDSGSELIDLPEKLEGLVYLPGTINLKPFHRLTREDFLQDFEVNLLGAVRSVQAALPALKRGDSPSVVMVSTVAVQSGLPFHASISASKAAVEGLVRSLSAELAPTIRVNAIAPSLSETPLAGRLLNTESKKENSAERHPLKRIGTPEDQANAIEFLLSDRSSWMTGQVIHVDGGMSVIR